MEFLKRPDEAEDVAGLPIPLGRRVELPGRGTTFIREMPGPPGAPTLVLLHGWLASAGLNWYQVFTPLGRRFRVIAPDLRGHARGLRSSRRFRLSDCADDTIATLDALGIDQAIMVGYSLGGPVAQLAWHQHRDRVEGLVLCSTSHSFMPGMRERFIFTTMMATMAGTSRLGGLMTALPTSIARQALPVSTKGRPNSVQKWAAAEMRRHDVRQTMEAGIALGHYDARKWIGEVDVPTVVLVTTKDRAVDPAQQARLAFSIPHAEIRRIEQGHVVCATPYFASPVMEACIEVAAQARPDFRPDRRAADRSGRGPADRSSSGSRKDG